MFFGIDRARFLTLQALGGARHAELIRSVSPLVEGKLLYVGRADRVVAVRAGGEIPSRASSLGSGLELISGTWQDSPADSAYITPDAEQLYHELDRFHLPARPDSTWAEWHYFNLVISPSEWWYVTFLIGGEITKQNGAARPDRWGGQMLITHRRRDGRHERFTHQYTSAAVTFDTTRADLRIGESTVRQRDGMYQLRVRAGDGSAGVQLDVDLRPAPNRYFPPVELRDDEFVSGYVVPGLVAAASGRVCWEQSCRRFHDVPAYHDHNWGVWQDVTWEWGAARGRRLALLYGGVFGPERGSSTEATPVRSPFFLAAVDSLGVKQVLRFSRIEYYGRRSAGGGAGFSSPEHFDLLATRDRDSLRLRVRVEDALATEMKTGAFRRGFLQMRGQFTVNGTVLGETVADTGTGFFETYVVPR
jgi:hypothetical protein